MTSEDENTPVRATFAEDAAANCPDDITPATSVAAPYEHNDLSLESRSLPDQHPQAAITGLVDSLAAKANTSDVNAALAAKAPLASPALTGTPTAPTAPTGTNTTQIATTAFVMNQGYAPLMSPALTGTPTAPTAPTGTDSPQIATTAFVKNQGYAPLVSPALIGTPTAPTAPSGTDSTQVATTAFVKNQGYAPLASPTFTGMPTAPTASTGTDTTQIATTAFVKSQGYAPLASPALTGAPTAPTAPTGTDSTQIATTAFAHDVADSAAASAVSSIPIADSTTNGLMSASQSNNLSGVELLNPSSPVQVGFWALNATTKVPVYKKTISTGALPNNAVKTVAHGISSFTNIIKMEGIAFDGLSYVPITWISRNQTPYVSMYADRRFVALEANGNLSGYTTSYVTLYYY